MHPILRQIDPRYGGRNPDATNSANAAVSDRIKGTVHTMRYNISSDLHFV